MSSSSNHTLPGAMPHPSSAVREIQTYPDTSTSRASRKPLVPAPTNIDTLLSLLFLPRDQHDDKISTGQQWAPHRYPFLVQTNPYLEDWAGRALRKLTDHSWKETWQMRRTLDTADRGTESILPAHKLDCDNTQVPKFKTAYKAQSALWQTQDLLEKTLLQTSDNLREREKEMEKMGERLKEAESQCSILKRERTAWESSVFYKAYSACQSARSQLDELIGWGMSCATSAAVKAAHIRQVCSAAYTSTSGAMRSWQGHDRQVSAEPGEENNTDALSQVPPRSTASSLKPTQSV